MSADGRLAGSRRYAHGHKQADDLSVIMALASR
jgi:hypothetical protein